MAKNNDAAWSRNKGEWTELYVFLKLLAQGKVQVINEKSEKDENIYYPIVKIMRKEHEEQIDYVIDKKEVIVKAESREIMRIDRSEIDKQADCLLKGIKNGSGLGFELQKIKNFAESIKVTLMTAFSDTTSDIFMQIYDENMQLSSDLGFSIKSYIGTTPTLVNPSKTTNFVYKVEGLTCEKKDEINKIKGTQATKGTKAGGMISRRMAEINKYKLSFVETYGKFREIFESNLAMIDKDMPRILAEMLLDFYKKKGSNNKGSANEGIGNCKTLIKEMGKRDPLNYGDLGMYEHKFKEFLCACALGMKPATRWDGSDEVNGGYINVKKDGEILLYRIYDRNSFKQYLLDNTKLDTPSTGEGKDFEYMELYEKNGEMFINLNLQIRFKNMQLIGGSEE